MQFETKKFCSFCKESGHRDSNCQELADHMCFFCYGYGHVIQNCPEFDPESCCSFCCETGHVTSDCQLLKDHKCVICKQTGHTRDECTVTPQCEYCRDNNMDYIGHMVCDCDAAQSLWTPNGIVMLGSKKCIITPN